MGDIWAEDFCRALEKRPRLNPLGEDEHLHPNGSVTRDEDKIIALQRISKEAAYKPGGKMYLKVRDHFYEAQRDDSPYG